MPTRSANAIWEGSLKEGHGQMKMSSGAYEGPYSFPSRFEDASGTNPEELIAAAHAGCFSMALSGQISKAGFTATQISTTAKVHLEKVGEGFSITAIDLQTEASVPGLSHEQFQELALAAKQGCPVSRALAGVGEIRLQATLLE